MPFRFQLAELLGGLGLFSAGLAVVLFLHAAWFQGEGLCGLAAAAFLGARVLVRWQLRTVSGSRCPDCGRTLEGEPPMCFRRRGAAVSGLDTRELRRP